MEIITNLETAMVRIRERAQCMLVTALLLMALILEVTKVTSVIPLQQMKIFRPPGNRG